MTQPPEAIAAILHEANEQTNIYAGAAYHLESRHLPFTLASPGDWLAWLLHDASLQEQMAQAETNDFDRDAALEDATLMRHYAAALVLQGVVPTPLDWDAGDGSR
jgi:hypothetical protein